MSTTANTHEKAAGSQNADTLSEVEIEIITQRDELLAALKPVTKSLIIALQTMGYKRPSVSEPEIKAALVAITNAERGQAK